MKQVTLIANDFKINFKNNGYELDGIVLKSSKNSTLYFTGMKNNMRMIEVKKRMQFDNEGNVYISFGKEKLNVGTYEEVLSLNENYKTETAY